MLKLYVHDNGVYGCIFTIATSIEDARKNMEGELNYSRVGSIEEYEISEGFTYSNLGDM